MPERAEVPMTPREHTARGGNAKSIFFAGRHHAHWTAQRCGAREQNRRELVVCAGQPELSTGALTKHKERSLLGHDKGAVVSAGHCHSGVIVLRWGTGDCVGKSPDTECGSRGARTIIKIVLVFSCFVAYRDMQELSHQYHGNFLFSW